MSNNLCPTCGKREADYEGVICSQCKNEMDQRYSEDDLKIYEEDMLGYNHHGETCWLRGSLCQEGWCSGCQIYLDWKESQKGVRAK